MAKGMKTKTVQLEIQTTWSNLRLKQTLAEFLSELEQPGEFQMQQLSVSWAQQPKEAEDGK